MRNVKIVRVQSDPDNGTFGVLLIDGEVACVTLEDYNRQNANNVSCIPAGQYICKRYSSPKYPNTFEVTQVQDRSYILFHPGNTDDDTAGCILLGSKFGWLGDNKAILESRTAFDNFITNFGTDKEFRLTIVEEF